MTVPFLDLKSQHTPLRDEISAAIQEVIDSSAFAGGPFVAKFEEDFAAFCHCPYAAGVANGGKSIEDPPGVREGGMGKMYLAYLRDPDGNKICALHRMN